MNKFHLRIKLIISGIKTKRKLLKELTVKNGFDIKAMKILYDNLRNRKCYNMSCNKVTVALEENAIDAIAFRMFFQKDYQNLDFSFYIRASKDETKYLINVKTVWTNTTSIYGNKTTLYEYEFEDRIHPENLVFATLTPNLEKEIFRFMGYMEYGFKHIIKETIDWW